ncbi:Leucyl aminopeptidase yscIV [Conoideocrella luteorostrata]|uniref:Leucyl aminopeptidase yscIV n=1 Tax=Conoideocrella luteorostrata TaxID=1105319 RepID=A0AAJ0CYZ0_9HYPO|nr:Leucyl aminopeptidase yscIV [Conoideocrella luteorostrata]
MAPRDPSTLSNYSAWRTRHTDLNFRIDFQNRILRGHVTLDLEALTDGHVSEVVLDSHTLDISSITVNSTPTTWRHGVKSDALGTPVHVLVPDNIPRGQIVKLQMHLQTTDRCTALLWLGPRGTLNNESFVFTQCYSIHARTMFPCQDTPDVKSTYTMKITSPFAVIASGLTVGVEETENEQTYHYEQKIPIPSYLFALASGNLTTAPIDAISSVVASPTQIKACQREFQGGISRLMEEAEKMLTPYRWGEYNLLVMPPSFPYGGFEYPVYNFASPTVVTGDGQGLKDVIPHELSHSWSGNLVTNCSWEHYWLNEGWTVYLERRLAAKVHCEAYFGLASTLGWRRLTEDVERLGPDHEFTKLCPNLSGIHPDDAFCSIPYEKGFCLVYYLERLVGRENFDKFIPHYFTVWSEKSLDSTEFRKTFEDFFLRSEYSSVAGKLAAIQWEELLHAPGFPEKPDYDTSLLEVCYGLAARWHDPNFIAQNNDIRDWPSSQKLAFLNAILDFQQPLSRAQSQNLGTVYELSATDNALLRTNYYRIALKAHDKRVCAGVVEFLGEVGTLRYVRQLFMALAEVDKDFAVRAFEERKRLYHPACVELVSKELADMK